MDLGEHIATGRRGTCRVEFEVPIRTISRANVDEFHLARAERVQAERRAVALCWPRGMVLPLPCQVTLTRRGRALDPGDNLPAALKAVRDELARLLGVDDRDQRVTWGYEQETGEPSVWVCLVADLKGAVLGPREKKVKVKRPKKGQPAAARPALQPTPAYVAPPRRSTT